MNIINYQILSCSMATNLQIKQFQTITIKFLCICLLSHKFIIYQIYISVMNNFQREKLMKITQTDQYTKQYEKLAQHIGRFIYASKGEQRRLRCNQVNTYMLMLRYKLISEGYSFDADRSFQELKKVSPDDIQRCRQQVEKQLPVDLFQVFQGISKKCAQHKKMQQAQMKKITQKGDKEF